MTDGSDLMLQIIRKTVRSEVSSDHPDLSLRQLAVLLTVYGTDDPQTVRGLAKHLNINKPAVTRALDRLRDFDLAQRRTDGIDRRSVNVMRTPTGASMMQRLADAMAAASCDM